MSRPPQAGPFGWGTGRPATPTEVFVRSLPPSPVRAHLGNLHSMYLESVEVMKQIPDFTLNERAAADRIALYEHSLRMIATATVERDIRKRPDTSRFRREFPKKEK